MNRIAYFGTWGKPGHGFAAGNVLDVAPAVTTSAFVDNNLLCIGYLIRKFTPRELFRLQDYNGDSGGRYLQNATAQTRGQFYPCQTPVSHF